MWFMVLLRGEKIPVFTGDSSTKFFLMIGRLNSGLLGTETRSIEFTQTWTGADFQRKEFAFLLIEIFPK